MLSMFEYTIDCAEIYVGDGWTTNNVISSGYMFGGCSLLPNFDANWVDETNAHTGEGGYLTYKAN